MLLPIVIFTPFLITTNYRQEVSVSDEGNPASAPQKIGEAAQNYGRTDAGPVIFPNSLLYATLVIAAGLFIGIVIYLLFKLITK